MRTRFFNFIGLLILASSFISAQLFISETAEGSSNHKYIEIYNAGSDAVDLSAYSLSSCSNGCNDGVSWDYTDNVTFDAGTMLTAGDVYVVCHGSSDATILAECDQTFTYLSNGDDVFALTELGGTPIVDILGTIGDDPGSGWDVCGVSNATKDHTLVRKSSVTSGNGGDWDLSAGTDSDDCEWLVLEKDDWSNVGSHTMDSPNMISLGAATDTQLEVLYLTDTPIAGFEFNITGATVNSASGGAASDAGFQLVTNDNKILGFSFSGATIPVGSGLLVNLEIQVIDAQACLTGVVISDINAQQVAFETGPCVNLPQDCDDVDADGICDDVDDCVGAFDECGVCNGNGIADGACDCDGNVLDECNVCGGNGIADGACDCDGNVLDDCNVCDGNGSTCVDAANLFFSEYAEGSSNNKYFEVYNLSNETVLLDAYAFATVSNAPTTDGEYEYWNGFTEGATVAPGDVYVVCHSSSDDTILAECDQYYTYLSNGDDGNCLVYGTEFFLIPSLLDGVSKILQRKYFLNI